MEQTNAQVIDRVRGCLLGGALGDALGAPVEFMSFDQIRNQFGGHGLMGLAPAYGRVGAITDDTQMTLFMAEGLIRHELRLSWKGIGEPFGQVHAALLRWLLTQGEWPDTISRDCLDIGGFLFGTTALHARRAPGNTCIGGLLEATGFGCPRRAANDSKGNGALMRIAPVGLLSGLSDDETFCLAAELAAQTHGHPTGQLAAGFQAVAIASLVQGDSLDAAFDRATECLVAAPHHAETLQMVEQGRKRARDSSPTPNALAELGGGWVAEEALGMAIWCSLAEPDWFAKGVRAAVNHSGDSDTVGAITGNLLGAHLGESQLPNGWLDNLEIRSEIDQVAMDLASVRLHDIDDALFERYHRSRSKPS